MSQNNSLNALRAILALALPLSACELADDPELGQDTAEIQFGNSKSATAYGAALSDAGCTFTLLDERVAITQTSCADASKDIDLDGSTARVRAVHAAINSQRNADASLALVSLKKAIAPKFSRGLDLVPVQQGETLECFGFTNGRLSSGYFEVLDSAGAVLSLGGHPTSPIPGARPYEITSEDVGGFCVRDGSLDPAAIVIGATRNGVASAARVHTLERAAHNAHVLDASVAHGAVRLLDDTESFLITAKHGAPYATFDGFQSNFQTQAFYRVDLGRAQVRLVDAESGDCLQADGVGARLARCNDAVAQQRFIEDVEYIDGFDRYGYRNSVGAITVTGGRLEMHFWTGGLEQRFRMWLAPY